MCRFKQASPKAFIVDSSILSQLVLCFVIEPAREANVYGACV